MERATALACASACPLAVVEEALASPLSMARPARMVCDARERSWTPLATTWPIVPSAPSAIAASARARAGAPPPPARGRAPPHRPGGGAPRGGTRRGGAPPRRGGRGGEQERDHGRGGRGSGPPTLHD